MVFRDGRTYPPTVPTHQKVFSKVVFITLNWGNQRCSAGNESECFLNSIRSVNSIRPFAQFGGDFIWSDNQNWCIEHQNEVSELLDIGIFFAYSVVYGYARISYCGKNSKTKQNVTSINWPTALHLRVYIHSYIWWRGSQKCNHLWLPCNHFSHTSSTQVAARLFLELQIPQHYALITFLAHVRLHTDCALTVLPGNCFFLFFLNCFTLFLVVIK